MKWKYFLKAGILIPIFGVLMLSAGASALMTGDVGLSEAVTVIQICAGMSSPPNPGIEGKVGLEDAIFALQVAAGIRKKILFAVEGNEPVSIDLSLTEPSAADSSFETVLPDGQAATLIRSDIITREENDYTWSGEVGGQEDSTVVMSVVDGAMFGYINTGSDSYLNSAGGRRLQGGEKQSRAAGAARQ